MCILVCVFFFFKQKTAYEMRISDWSSDVCSSDLAVHLQAQVVVQPPRRMLLDQVAVAALGLRLLAARLRRRLEIALLAIGGERHQPALRRGAAAAFFCFPRPAFLAAFFGVFLPPPALPPSALRRSASRSEEHTSELQSLIRISY